MNPQKTNLLSMIPENTTFIVSGTIAFSHISEKYDGEALLARNKSDREHNRQPVTTPYTTITINNAQVHCADPTNPTAAEQYAQLCLYDTKKGEPQAGKSFTAKNTGTSLPYVGQLTNGNTVTEVKLNPGTELDNGLKVMLVIRIFRSKTYNSNGVTLESVIATEPIRYYTGSNNLAETLKAHGLIWTPTPQTTTVPNNPYSTQDNTLPTNPFGQNAPIEPAMNNAPFGNNMSQMPVETPMANPAPFNGMPQMPFSQPMTNAQPQPAFPQFNQFAPLPPKDEPTASGTPSGLQYNPTNRMY